METAFHTLYITGSYRITRPLYSGIGTILAFHRVCPKSEKRRIRGTSRLEVTPEYLENTIRFFIKRNYEIVSLDKVFSVLRGSRIDKKFVIFTFDDGYVDNLTYAYPVFKKYNAPFTVYITTNFPDRRMVLWWYLLEDIIAENERICIELAGKPFKFNCSTTDEKEAVFYMVCSLIKADCKSGYPEQFKKIFAPYMVDTYKKTDELMLSWKEIERLSRDPLVTIGAHGISHSVLSKLLEPAAKYEIIESKKRIESHIKREVKHFAYPFGTRKEIGEREFKIVKECGFKTSTTTRQGNIYFAHRDHMECLPRAIISGEREGKKIGYLNLWIDGTVGCVRNGFKRITTL